MELDCVCGKKALLICGDEKEVSFATVKCQNCGLSVFGFTAERAIERWSNVVAKQCPMEHHHTKVFKVNGTARESICPSCLGSIVTNENEYPNFCVWCGQKIDWRDKGQKCGNTEQSEFFEEPYYVDREGQKIKFNDPVKVGGIEIEPTISVNIPQPTMQDIVDQIINSVDKQPFSSVGVMGFDGKMAYTYTVKAGGRY